MSDQDFTARPEDAPAGEEDSLTLDPSFSFAPLGDPEPAEATGIPETLAPAALEGPLPEAPLASPSAEDAPARILEPVMRGADAEHAPAPGTEPLDEAAPSLEAPEDAPTPAENSAPVDLPTSDDHSRIDEAPAAEQPKEEGESAGDAPAFDPSETVWAAVRDRGRVLTGEEVDLPGEVTDEDDVVGVASPVETSQIEPVTLGPHTTTIPVMTGEVPLLAPVDPTPTPVDVLAHRSDPEAAPEDGADIESTAVQRRAFVTAPPLDEEAAAPEAAWRPREETAERGFVPATPRSLDDALFEGSTLSAEVPSRTGAHWGSLIGHLLLVPIAWFLLADAGARLTVSEGAAMTTGVWSPLALAELLGGVLVAVIILLLVKRSSLGAWVSGALVAIAGLPWLLVPGLTAERLLPAFRWLNGWNAFGTNISHHLQASGYTGRLLLLGLGLIGAGILSHTLRRTGRKEEALRAEVEKVNPAGAHFTARERRKAAKAAGLR